MTWLLIHLLYRIRIEGAENLPAKGPVVLACNHVSYVDALVIGGSIRRPVRFVMYYKYFDWPLVRLLFRAAGVVPICSSREDPELLQSAFEQIDKLLSMGEVICVFPEGQLTRTGELNEFRPGIMKIVSQHPVTVVPMALSGLWGTFFSRAGKGAMRRLPRPLWYRVVLRIGEPLPPDEFDSEGLRDSVARLLEPPPAAD